MYFRKRDVLRRFLAIIICIAFVIPHITKVQAGKKQDFYIKNGVLLKYNGTDTKVKIPKNVKKIGKEAFANSKIEEVSISGKVSGISQRAFYGCNYLKTVKISGKVKSIGNMAFYGCKKLEKLKLNNGLKKIGAQAFGDCSSLKKLDIPKSVDVIKKEAFAGCNNLSELNVKNIHTKIDKSAFKDCKINNLEWNLASKKNDFDETEKKTEDTGNTGNTGTGFGEVFFDIPKVENNNNGKINSPEVIEKKIINIEENSIKITINKGTGEDEWYKQLPLYLNAVLNDGSKKIIPVKSWKNKESVNTDLQGSYFVTAEYDLPKGISGDKIEVKAEIHVKEKEVEKKIVSIEPNHIEIEVEKGVAKDVWYSQLPIQLLANISDGSKVNIAVNGWKDWDRVDTSQIGKYEITAEYDLPEGISGDKIEVKAEIHVKEKEVEKKIVSIEPNHIEIEVEKGVAKDVWYSQLPTQLLANISDGSKVNIAVNGWANWTRVNVWQLGKYEITAEYDLPEGISGDKIEVKAEIHVKAKPQEILLETDKSEYYYKDNPILTIKNYTGSEELKVIKGAADSYTNDKVLTLGVEYDYEETNHKITIYTDKIFKKDNKDFAQDEELYIIVELGEKKLPLKTLRYKPYKKAYAWPNEYSELERSGVCKVNLVGFETSDYNNIQAFVGTNLLKNTRVYDYVEDEQDYTCIEIPYNSISKYVPEDDSQVNLTIKCAGNKDIEVRLSYKAAEGKQWAIEIIGYDKDENIENCPTFAYNDTTTIKINISGADLTKEYIDKHLTVKIQSGTYPEFTVPGATGYNSEAKWYTMVNSGVLQLRVYTDDYGRGKIAYKKNSDGTRPHTFVKLSLDGYVGEQVAEVIIVP